MSHFTLTVRVPAGTPLTDIDDVLADKLAPYCEQTEDKRFVTFRDEEDEYRKEYDTGTRTMVRTPKGELLAPWDERFRVAGEIGIGTGTHRTPIGHLEIEVPFKELYKTFEEFCANYHGHEARDPEQNRYGYWRNPNAKWDWYSIGGRWTGFYPIKSGIAAVVGRPGLMTDPAEPGTADIVRICDIDFSKAENTGRERARDYAAKYVAWVNAGCKGGGWDSPRSYAMNLGLVRVVEEGVPAPAAGEIVVPWADLSADDKRRGWHDVVKLVTDVDRFVDDYKDEFFSLRSYAGLDEKGWFAPGEMGWFGCSNDTPESRRAYASAFRQRFLEPRDSQDILVLVDCHI